MTAAPRYTQIALPIGRFLPGSRNPGERPRDHAPLSPDWPGDPARWRESLDYVYGCDLFNARFWWEAHESWEVAWKQFPNDCPAKPAVQMMIQTAAAVIKKEIGNQTGVTTLLARIEAQRGTLSLSLPASHHCMGLDVMAWCDEARRYLEGGSDYPFIRIAGF